MSKGLSVYQQIVLQGLIERGPINILEVCTLVICTRATKKDPSFKPSFWNRIESLEELDNNAQGMYRMMRSLEKRGLVEDFFTEGLQYGIMFLGMMGGQS
jgi:hypothetical protein